MKAFLSFIILPSISDHLKCTDLLDFVLFELVGPGGMVPNASGNPVNHGLTLPGSGTTVFPLPGSFPWSTGARGTGLSKPFHLDLELLSY